MAWFTSSDLSATNGSNVIIVGDTADPSVITSADALLLESYTPVEISHVSAGNIVLIDAWPFPDVASGTGKVQPTAGNFNDAVSALTSATENFEAVDNIAEWEQGPNSIDDTSPPEGNDDLKGYRPLNDDDGGVQYIMTPAEMERFATEQAEKVADIEAWYPEIQQWHTDVDGWQQQVNTQYNAVDTWHGEVDTWQQQVSVWHGNVNTWQQQVYTNTVAAAASEAKAAEWADSDSAVETGRYSAKYWAGQAEEIVGGNYVTTTQLTVTLQDYVTNTVLAATLNDYYTKTNTYSRTEMDARYSQAGHGHTIANVSGLQTALDAKSDSNYIVKTADYTLVSGDKVICNSGTQRTFTIPASSAGQSFTVVNGSDTKEHRVKLAAGTARIGGTTITTSDYILLAPSDEITLISVSANLLQGVGRVA